MDATPLINPQSTSLKIGYDRSTVPSDQDGWGALGECIGSHEHLQELIFYGIDVCHNPTREDLEALLIGVGRNRTVREFGIIACDGEWPLGMLEIFFRDNQNLHLLKAYSCSGGVFRSLSTALGGCTSSSLQLISCWNSRIGDENTAEFIEALAGLPQLKKLEMNNCDIGPRGCGAAAALLQSPACVLQTIYLDNNGVNDESLAVLERAVDASSTLEELSLCGMDHISPAQLQSFADVLRSPTCMLKILFIYQNNIGDDEIISFSDALATNRRLEELVLEDENSISYLGFAAMARTLCNTSSIGDVYSSNHTLQDLCLCEMPNDLRNYLHMNCGKDKVLVARQKIFMHFFKGDFSMEPFHENAMAPNILPHLLSWIGRTPNWESFVALFNFLRRMPPVWGDRRPVLRRSRRKRKVRN